MTKEKTSNRKSLSREAWEESFCSEIDDCERVKELSSFDNYCIKKGSGCQYILVGHNWRDCGKSEDRRE